MLKVENIDVFYGDLQALWDVSIEVQEKELVAVVGSNGAGKTTLLNTISGLLRPAKGSISFEGKRIDRLPPHEIPSLAMALVPEGRRIFPYITVMDNLRLGAYTTRARKEITKTLRQVFDLFPILEERKKQLAGTLSGGEQQMLAIARALMSRPKLLMMDEPSLGLAPVLVEKIFDTVNELKRLGVTILLVEQNVSVSLRLADRAYVMENGKIVLSGKGQELLNNEHVKKAYLGI